MPGNIDTLRKSLQLIINFVKVAGQKVGKFGSSNWGPSSYLGINCGPDWLHIFSLTAHYN